jgi:hypothetical protein
MDTVTVVVLRRNMNDLPAEQIEAIQRCFSGKQIRFVRTDPTDYKEHDTDCRKLDPVVVILPLEKPIPSAAMERGVPHVTFAPNGSILKLKPFRPEFEPFIPSK